MPIYRKISILIILIIFFLLITVRNDLIFSWKRNVSGIKIISETTIHHGISKKYLDGFARDVCQRYWLEGKQSTSDIDQENALKHAIECSHIYVTVISYSHKDNLMLASVAVLYYPELAQSWFWLADVYETSDSAQAINAYINGLRKQPYNGVAWYRLANLYEQESKYELAIEAFIKSCDYLNKGSDCYVRAGKNFEKIEKIQEAIFYYRLSIFPEAHLRADELEKGNR